MKKIVSIQLIGVMFLTFSVMGCKKFLDTNQNPNNPEDASAKLLLPSAQAAISTVVGSHFQIYGGMFAQYWTQNTSSSQYKSIDRYNPVSTAFDGVWLNIYTKAIENLQLIIDRQGEQGITQHQGIANILKGYILQIATDAFGDVPSSEAANPTTFGSPKYDAQSVVYDSIFSIVKRGIGMLDNNAELKPANEDLIFGGDMDKWKAFGNTLLLRAYLRLSAVDPAKSQAGIAELYATSPNFLTEDATISYSSAGGNTNPLYGEMVGLNRTQNLVASQTAVSQFLKNNDPRLYALYDKLPGEDTIAYVPQGAFDAFTDKEVSHPSALVGASAQDPNSALAPVKLISASESSFLQAEAIARGYATGDDRGLFQDGIAQSFDGLGLTEGESATYIASAPDAIYPSATNDKIKAIITQKYYAMNGFQGFEAWTEWRRTGYPNFFVISGAATVMKFPLRLLYPTSELTTNIHFTNGEYSIIDIFQPVWWNKN